MNRRFDATPESVWHELIDWPGHGEWIPATRVEVHDPDPTAVGARFTAWTGFGPLALEDRMRVAALAWDRDDRCGRCEVDKLGPVLKGRAWFVVAPDGEGASVAWFEDVSVRYVPQVVAPLLAYLGAAGFRQGMRRLARRLSSPRRA